MTKDRKNLPLHISGWNVDTLDRHINIKKTRLKIR
jgi:hypothetical protein